MYAIFASTGLVAIAEIGDKTQLLALFLAARFRRPVPVVLGILVPTLLNYALAAYTGDWIGSSVDPSIVRWIVGGSAIAIALWALIPDHLDHSAASEARPSGGPFLTTALAFFIAEFGDKTQFATAMLAAQFGALVPVVAGTTLGVFISDAPAVFLGHQAGRKLNLRLVCYVAAAIFGLFGAATLAAG